MLRAKPHDFPFCFFKGPTPTTALERCGVKVNDTCHLCLVTCDSIKGSIVDARSAPTLSRTMLCVFLLRQLQCQAVRTVEGEGRGEDRPPAPRLSMHLSCFTRAFAQAEGVTKTILTPWLEKWARRSIFCKGNESSHGGAYNIAACIT